MKAEKMSLRVFIDEKGNLVGAIYHHPVLRKKIIVTIKEASEDDIVELLECKEVPIKKDHE